MEGAATLFAHQITIDKLDRSADRQSSSEINGFADYRHCAGERLEHDNLAKYNMLVENMPKDTEVSVQPVSKSPKNVRKSTIAGTDSRRSEELTSAAFPRRVLEGWIHDELPFKALAVVIAIYVNVIPSQKPSSTYPGGIKPSKAAARHGQPLHCRAEGQVMTGVMWLDPSYT